MFNHRCRSSLLIMAGALFTLALLFQPRLQAQSTFDIIASEPEPADAAGLNLDGARSITDIEVQPVESMDKDEAEAMLEEEAARNGLFEPRTLPGGLDHLAAGTGTRNAGYGTIRLRGVPPGAQVVRAYLYWGTIRNAPFGESPSFNGTPVTGQLVGTAQNPCWGSGGTFAAFRAEVTSLMAAGINADYRVTNLPSFITDGRDPWRHINFTLPMSEGASLVVIYSHKSVPLSARYYIYHNANYFAGTLNVNHSFSDPIPAHTSLKHTRLGADGQSGDGLRPYAWVTDERTYMGATASSLTQIRGISGRNTSSDWNGYDGQPLNQLWDTNTDDVTGALPSGIGSYLVRYVSQGDCIVLVAQVLSAR